MCDSGFIFMQQLISRQVLFRPVPGEAPAGLVSGMNVNCLALWLSYDLAILLTLEIVVKDS